MQQEATVFVIDDDEQARRSVCALVGSMGLAAEAFASAEEFLASDAPSRPGCVVTDLRMLGMSGLELQEALHARGVAVPIIILTAYARTPTTVQAMRGGAVTVLDKPYTDDDLWGAIRNALAEDERRRQAQRRREELQARIDSLTPAERHVMEQILLGKPNKTIAAELDVSIRTVEHRRHEVFSKLQAGSVAELVRLAVEAGLAAQVRE